jgi:hypothetical protein
MKFEVIETKTTKSPPISLKAKSGTNNAKSTVETFNESDLTNRITSDNSKQLL